MEYDQRINLVVDYIRQNLQGDLSLDALAGVAAFSPYHFHRIFKAITGETVNQCVLRLRLERAVALMKTSPQMQIQQAAFESGFVSVSTFSRVFRKQYGISARQWDRKTVLKNSKNGQVLAGFPRYTEFDAQFEVKIRELPQQHMAFIRVTNAYETGDLPRAYERLCQWFNKRGGKQTTLYGMSQDDPAVTPLALCRYDICMTVPEDWQGEGEISVRVFPACHIAYIHTAGDIYLINRAWQYLYSTWLPRSRFLPDNLPAMEIYYKQPAELGWKLYDIDCAVPIIAF